MKRIIVFIVLFFCITTILTFANNANDELTDKYFSGLPNNIKLIELPDNFLNNKNYSTYKLESDVNNSDKILKHLNIDTNYRKKIQEGESVIHILIPLDKQDGEQIPYRIVYETWYPMRKQIESKNSILSKMSFSTIIFTAILILINYDIPPKDGKYESITHGYTAHTAYVQLNISANQWKTYGAAEDCRETVWTDLYEGNSRKTVDEKHYYSSTEHFDNLSSLIKIAYERYSNKQKPYIEYLK